jgi:REP element-mobilizing transposase RayT
MPQDFVDHLLILDKADNPHKAPTLGTGQGIDFSVAIWAYCLMPNHVHLIAVPESQEGLARAIGEAHRRYTRQGKYHFFYISNERTSNPKPEEGRP